MDLISKELLAFDLDGTLIDSSGDIAWAANKTLGDFGYEGESPGSVKEKIGSGVVVLLERLMPEENPARIAAARDIFLTYYSHHLVVDPSLYPGVMETLVHFMDMGKTMAIITNKPKALADGILDVFGLGVFFGAVAGGDTFSNRKPHPEPLEEVMRSCGAAPAETVFVGDSLIDAETGRRAGVFTVGVSYGFGHGVVGAADFDRFIDSFGELEEIIS